MDSHVKSINTDKRSKKRIKFASGKERAKRASADVYRSYKRKLGATSAATREEFVHNIQGTNQAKKRHRSSHSPLEDSNRSAVVKLASTTEDDVEEPDIELDVSSTFAEELDVAIDRNASEVFGKFHREMWKLVRSLPEVLHNSKKIVEILLSYMLSPASLPERPCQMSDWQDQSPRKEFVINHATTDILHLLSVLARDLRHEIHPFLHGQILPRIIYDLLNPPPPPPDSGKQPIPRDVTIVEAAFRTMAYILRYDSEVMTDDLESMRKYYGATIANRREIVRRLATETFAPLVRRIKSKSARQKHLKRVLKALASTERQTITHQLKRTQSDAVDGISLFIFQVTKGVPGRLHSQGLQMLQYIFNLGATDGSGASGRLVFSVLSKLLERLCHQMNEEVMSIITKESVVLVKKSITLYLGDQENSEAKSFTPVMNTLKLLEQIANFRSGESLNGQKKQVSSDLFNALESLCKATSFHTLEGDVKIEVVKHLCPPLKVLQSHAETAPWLERFLSELLKHDISDGPENANLVCSMAETLSRDLMSEVVNKGVFSAVAQALLNAASSVANHNPDSALLITFSVASRGMAANETVGEESAAAVNTCVEAQLFANGGDWCNVASSEKQKLVSCCLLQCQSDILSRELVAKLIMAVRCVPFVALISHENEESDVQKKHFKNASNWLLETVKYLQAESMKKNIDNVVTIAMSIALESLTHLAIGFWNTGSAPEKAVLQAKPIAERLLSEHGGSMWAIRAVAVYTRALLKMEKCLDNDLDKTFDELVPNLRSKSHALRLYSLEVLNTFPEKHFVTDHSDLDLTGDLDEEPSVQQANTSAKMGPRGPCDILKTLYRLETIPIKLANERSFSALMSRIEVLARSGKLPIVYAEAAANYMLGSLYIKFAPVWPEAIRCMTSLLQGHEKNCWPALEAKLRSSMERPPKKDENDRQDNVSNSLFSFGGHLNACEEWESSYGSNVYIFGNSDAIENIGTARHHMTDEDTATENIWGVAAESQQVVAKNSRVVIPVFLAFMHNQYFAVHQNDPDARELELKDYVPPEECVTYDGNVDKGIAYRRLICFLKVFAVLDGPKQLVHHKLLERIFRCFLSHQDETVAKLSVSALSKYKAPYLVPYQSFFFDVLKKGQLKDALLDFAEKYKEGTVTKSHRAQLIPLLVRILFGRLSPKGKKSSKDSPASRRAAVLSFLSVLCEEEDEVFGFVFMMTRNFIPRNEKLLSMEQITPEDRDKVMNLLMFIRPEDLAALPSGVIEGFLHLLESVLVHLGHRIISYIPQFTSIVLALCKMAADGRQNDEQSDEQIEKEDGAMNPEPGHPPLVSRYSSIRSLGCKRLSEIYGRFGDAIDVDKFGPLTWEALHRSVYLLPEMTTKAEKAPAILDLLEVMSRDWRTIKMLAMHEKAVESVVKCIAETSMFSVMNATLSIVENLLTVDGPSSGSKESTGIRLIRKFIPLLMERFTARLERGGEQLGDPRSDKGKDTRKGGNRQGTWRRELEILCRVSELLSDDDGCLKDRSSILATLFSLLLPFLEPDSMTNDDDKMNIIGILKSTLSQLERESMAEIYSTISKILAPSKGKPGIRSLTVRHAVAGLVDAIATKDTQYRQVADSLLKLTAVHSKRVDEMDFDLVIPELNRYSQPEAHKAWLRACGSKDFSPSTLNPLIATFFQFLHNEDGVVLRAAHSSLKMIIELAATKANEGDESMWTKLVESSIVPVTRAGLQSRDATVRRYYILLVKEIATSFRDFSSANLIGDLHVLVNDENPDLDFFMNITHVQIHRRARGFQRLRSSLNDTNISKRLSLQSVSNILLPITLHPLYECKTKAEETFALEAIATVGSISRLLSWSKYNNMLWAMLTHFDRYPQQERYLIGAICAAIDSFHFDLIETKEESTEMPIEEQKTSVWRSLERRMIPKIEGLQTKETVDRNGTRTKILRPTITLALLKLFQKFPVSFFEAKLPHILSVICDALRDKDSDARDVARKTMAKIVVSMDLKYLSDVIREISITLTEGYKLHVRAAVLHTILQELSACYKPSMNGEASPAYFDESIGGQMELIQEDLFGEANERRESKETNVRFVKEAGGSKSIDSVELICRMLKFRPSDVASNGLSGSSIHCVVSPLLERLRQPDVDITTIRKIRQLLSRVVVGLSLNPSVDAEQLFPFVYATVEPFIGHQTIAAAQRSEESDEEDDDEMRPIIVSGSQEIKQAKNENKKPGKVALWRPSALKMVGSAKDAQEQKTSEKLALRKVKDGASAPKLTGSGRHEMSNAAARDGLNEPASITAVVFGLNLLNTCLKKLKLDHPSLPSLMDPFVPLLTACVCFCKESDVALVGLKCLMSLLRFDLPSIPSCSGSLGTQALEFLTSSGSSLNQNADLIQACFKTLTYLIKSGSTSESDVGETKDILIEGEKALAKNRRMPLNADQMRVLISTLQLSVTDSDQHNPALGLIKAILARRYVSSELYDLMEVMLKLVVRSHTAALRQQSSAIFVRFLLDYPMGEQRFEKHLKQIVANTGYEYQDGRLSAIQLVTAVIEKLPEELLSKHTQSIFIPLVLQMVNDESDKCHDAIVKCLETLFRRSTTEILQVIHGYIERWGQQPGALRSAAVEVLGILVDARSDFIQKQNFVPKLVKSLHSHLEESDSDWQVSNFSILCVEKLSKQFASELAKAHNVWKCIVETLVNDNASVRLSSCQVLHQFFAANQLESFLTKNPGMLFEIGRNLCFQMNASENEIKDEVSDLCIKTLSLALPIMKEKPELCFTNEEERDGRDPVYWLLQRLSQIAKAKGSKRRMAVFKCFAAFCTLHSEIVEPHLELILEPLHRSTIEARNELENPNVTSRNQTSTHSETLDSESNFAAEVLQVVEESVTSTEVFLNAMSAVKRRARDKKEQRKLEVKLEAANDPQAAAERKIKKQEREKQRKKRRVAERKQERGSLKKRRNQD